MLAILPLDSASHLLTWSNRIYVIGGVLTLGSAAMVLYEKHSKNLGRALRWGLATEITVIVAAFISLCGTVGAITFGNIVSHLKDIDLQTYQAQARLQISQANKDAAIANQRAKEAQDQAALVANDNLKLQGRVSSESSRASTAETNLAKQNQDTFNYAHSLAQQQATMAEQAHVSPVLTDYQITNLATELLPFSGSDVILHSTLDTTVLRLKNTIAMALYKAGITFKENSMDAGQTYQGVSVVVHSPQDVPPLANSLVVGLRASGIDVHAASINDIPAGKVAIYLGPN